MSSGEWLRQILCIVLHEMMVQVGQQVHMIGNNLREIKILIISLDKDVHFYETKMLSYNLKLDDNYARKTVDRQDTIMRILFHCNTWSHGFSKSGRAVIIICSAADHQVCHSSLGLPDVSTESDNVR